MPQQIDGMEYSDEQILHMVSKGLLAPVQKNDPASTTLTAVPFHGQFHGNANQIGILSTPGVRPERFTAVPRVRSFSSVLPFVKSDVYNEIFDVITGVTAGSGSNPDSFCGTPAKAGQFKKTGLTVRFGWLYIGTNLASVPLIGLRQNRADVPGKLLNSGEIQSRFTPGFADRIDDTQDLIKQEFYTLGMEIERSAEKVLFNGSNSESNATTERGFIKEFDGLDQFIKTGYTAPGMDSAVTSFNAAVTGTMSNGLNVVQAIADMYFGLQSRAEVYGLEGATWAIAMRRDQFRALTDVYAWSYYTRSMTGSAGLPITQMGTEVTNFRDSMFNGQYLVIEGEQVPVVFSSGIPRETLANNTYKADMYFVPISWNGMPLTYFEYADMANPYIQRFLGAFPELGKRLVPVDDGRYLVGERDTPMCMEYQIAGLMRLIVEVPFLAGRVDDIWYNFTAPIREAYPTDSFYANGGQTYQGTTVSLT